MHPASSPHLNGGKRVFARFHQAKKAAQRTYRNHLRDQAYFLPTRSPRGYVVSTRPKRLRGERRST